MMDLVEVCVCVCLSVCPDNTLKTIADISYVDRRKMAEDFARQDHKSKWRSFFRGFKVTQGSRSLG